ncbi:putative glycerol-1-phosphate prenyltransferase [Marinilabilia salmonicolor]|jgi:putative glycerol-1-phosphate prenyltransferase|uniref:Geranylgeranylglyceryl phosphate synthase n=2 Tax=Marinilabilia salmonicolor TaxID=989 RepID=A0A2T0XTA5_9BACT|nr:putative glycerol-1-phosphate prenyltransferase [Marinilabilia salmonicolor]RCW36139.1 putative glycerol-1-phosphate prenyltransferase [Marinilabilia salmonicolor]
MLALLIDPDKCRDKDLEKQTHLINIYHPELILVGGSLTTQPVDPVVEYLKQHTDVPVVLYPGHPSQVSYKADALLFLSMISGRNAELLIGAHVTAAPAIRQNRLETIPTGYMLIDGGSPTSVEYISQTRPIPAEKNDIAVATAMAGEMLGLRMIYMDAGSGAKNAISADMIRRVKEHLQSPLMIGGGINTPEKLKAAFSAGADIVVVGNVLEKDPTLLKQFTEITAQS